MVIMLADEFMIAIRNTSLGQIYAESNDPSDTSSLARILSFVFRCSTHMTSRSALASSAIIDTTEMGVFMYSPVASLTCSSLSLMVLFLEPGGEHRTLAAFAHMLYQSTGIRVVSHVAGVALPMFYCPPYSFSAHLYQLLIIG